MYLVYLDVILYALGNQIILVTCFVAIFDLLRWPATEPAILLRYACIPKYFIIFDTFLNEIVFFTTFSDILLLVYRNATVICMLILYPAILLNLFINSFLVESLEFSIRSYHLQTKTIYFFSDFDTFLAAPRGLRDLSFLSRDRTRALSSESSES